MTRPLQGRVYGYSQQCCGQFSIQFTTSFRCITNFATLFGSNVFGYLGPELRDDGEQSLECMVFDDGFWLLKESEYAGRR